MDTTYIIEKESIVDVLDDIQDFENVMSKFIELHPHYSYNINIKEDIDRKWIVELNVRNDSIDGFLNQLLR